MIPEYMKEIFHKTVFSTHRPLNLGVNKNPTTKYGNISQTCQGPHTWSFLPNLIKKETDYTQFKECINEWFCMNCKSYVLLSQGRECQFNITNTTEDWARF